MFELYDPEGELTVSERNLPHWEQPGATYFITFRTADSIPADVMRAWKRSRDDWLRRQKINPLSRSWREKLRELSPSQREEFHERFTVKFHNLLDAGHGACLLKRPELAAIVASSLRHFDGDRYNLGDFVVMPNHVHLIVQMLGEIGAKEQCKSWKHFTARLINKATGATGSFWQTESFDHLVRTSEQFDWIRRYIAENPIKANLKPGEYLLWRRE